MKRIVSGILLTVFAFVAVPTVAQELSEQERINNHVYLPIEQRFGPENNHR